LNCIGDALRNQDACVVEEDLASSLVPALINCFDKLYKWRMTSRVENHLHFA
jgi:hypothetical protein